jgi:hypothetical protein
MFNNSRFLCANLPSHGPHTGPLPLCTVTLTHLVTDQPLSFISTGTWIIVVDHARDPCLPFLLPNPISDDWSRLVRGPLGIWAVGAESSAQHTFRNFAFLHVCKVSYGLFCIMQFRLLVFYSWKINTINLTVTQFYLQAVYSWILNAVILTLINELMTVVTYRMYKIVSWPIPVSSIRK